MRELMLAGPGWVTCRPAALKWKTSRRPSGGFQHLVRFVGHLSYFKAASLLLLPESLGLAAAAAVALSFSVAAHEISASLATQPWSRSDLFTPARGALLLLCFLLLVGPAVTLLLSPASLGADAATSPAVALAILLLMLPCCLSFGVAQWRVRSHNRLLFRLGLLTIIEPRGALGVREAP